MSAPSNCFLIRVESKPIARAEIYLNGVKLSEMVSYKVEHEVGKVRTITIKLLAKEIIIRPMDEEQP